LNVKQLANRGTRDNNTYQDRGRIAADPSYTTGHAGPHPAVRRKGASDSQ
jgi:hypothetical protein